MSQGGNKVLQFNLLIDNNLPGTNAYLTYYKDISRSYECKTCKQEEKHTQILKINIFILFLCHICTDYIRKG